MGKQKRPKAKSNRPTSPNAVDWEKYVFDRVVDGTFPQRWLTRTVATPIRNTQQLRKETPA